MTQSEHLRLQEEFTRMHAKYRKALKTRASYKVHDRARCDDLVQSTFMKVWAYLMRGGTIKVKESFLFHVLNGLIIDEYRRQKPVSLDALLEEGFEPSLTDSERQIDILDGKIAMQLIPHLPEKYHQILTMRYVEELSLDEIAKQTGESKNTLAVKIHRGLLKLRKIYDSERAPQRKQRKKTTQSFTINLPDGRILTLPKGA